MQRAVAVAVMMLAGFAQAAPVDVASLGWLEGRWSGTKDGVFSEELWTGARGGAVLGLHRDIKGDSVVSWEFFRIAATKDGVVYFASPRSAPPTPFALVETGTERAVFENKQHDFPQRILYWREGGSLHARIEGPMDGKTVSEDWVWTKQP